MLEIIRVLLEMMLDQNMNIEPDCNVGGLVRCHFSKMISFCMQLNAI